jgi:methyltransferase family protein
MFETFLRHLSKVPQLAKVLLVEPAEAWEKLPEAFARWCDSRRPACAYEPAPDWERQLHEMLGVRWPCDATAEFWALWTEVMFSFKTRGVSIGRGAFGGWGDGDPGLVRALWCLTRHLGAANVVETGVARGFTSRFILEALERNGTGHLWSIDLPPQLKPELHDQIGAAVDDRLRHRWSYIRGSSRQHLPELLARLKQIDLFIHDSSHTERNVRFELDRAWGALKAGGALVVDDIDYNWGFHSFAQAFSVHHLLVCHAEPDTPDPLRFGGTGLFGVIRKEVPKTKIRMRHAIVASGLL